MIKRIVIISLASLLFGYIGWILVPFDESIKVNDDVGLTEAQIEMLIANAKSMNSYRETTVANLKNDSFFTPWARGRLFISITGTHSEVEVHAGFNGGPLCGGGNIFQAKWIDGEWVYDRTVRKKWMN